MTVISGYLPVTPPHNGSGSWAAKLDFRHLSDQRQQCDDFGDACGPARRARAGAKRCHCPGLCGGGASHLAATSHITLCECQRVRPGDQRGE